MSSNLTTKLDGLPSEVAPGGSVSHETAAQAHRRLSCGAADRVRLEQWVRASTAAHRLVLRSRIVLLLADGQSQAGVARALGVSRDTVARWARRFSEGGVDALQRDRPGRGRRPGRNRQHVARVLEALRSAPPGTWTVRTLAAHVGVSAASVQRIWRERTLALERQAPGQFLSHAGVLDANAAGKTLASSEDGDVAPSAMQRTV